MSADCDDFVRHCDARVPFVLPRLHELGFVQAVVLGLDFREDALLDELSFADTFLRLVVAFIEHDPIVEEFLLSVADKQMLALIDHLNHVILLHHFLLLLDD